MKKDKYYIASPTIVDPSLILKNKELSLRFFKTATVVGIHFRVQDQELTAEHPEALGFCLEHMPHIQRIGLHFSGATLPPKAFKLFVQQFTKVAKPLEDYYIHLDRSTITDEQLCSLFEASKPLCFPELWKFSLKLSETQISNKPFFPLKEMLINSTKMEELDLVFSRCRNVTDIWSLSAQRTIQKYAKASST